MYFAFSSSLAPVDGGQPCLQRRNLFRFSRDTCLLICDSLLEPFGNSDTSDRHLWQWLTAMDQVLFIHREKGLLWWQSKPKHQVSIQLG